MVRVGVEPGWLVRTHPPHRQPGSGRVRTAYDRRMRRIDGTDLARLVAVAAPSLAVATAAIAILQALGVPNASAAYLPAVVATAFVAGTWGAVIAAVASFLLYDFLFVAPLYTFTVSNPGRMVEPRSSPLHRDRGRTARRAPAIADGDRDRARERGARALPGEPRAGDPRLHAGRAARRSPTILRHETAMGRVWIALGADDARERVAADTGTDAETRDTRARHQVLQRTPGETPARWSPGSPAGPGRGAPAAGRQAYRVRIEAASRPFGSIWALRDRGQGEPDPTETRLISRRRRPDRPGPRPGPPGGRIAGGRDRPPERRLKSALLQSVSHDLRTPLATIRAAAGTLRPGSGLSAGRPAGERRRHRPRGRVPQSAGDQPARPAAASRPARCAPNGTSSSSTTSSAGRIERLRPRLGDRPLELDARRAAGRGRPDLPRRSADQRRSRTRSSTRRPGRRSASPPARFRTSRRPADGRGRRAGRARPRRCRGCSTSSIASRACSGGSRSGTGIGLAVRSRAGRGDGRPRRRLAAATSAVLPSTSTCRRRPSPAAVDGRGGAVSTADRPATDRRSSSSRMTTRHARRSSRELTARGYRTDRGRGRRVRADALGEPPAGPRAARPRPARHGRPRASIRRIRREATTPIVILSGRYDEREKVEALERGADDYVTKPFGVDELNARLRRRAAARRRAVADAAGLHHGRDRSSSMSARHEVTDRRSTGSI